MARCSKRSKIPATSAMPKPWSGWARTSIPTPSTPSDSRPTSPPSQDAGKENPPPKNRDPPDPRPSPEGYGDPRSAPRVEFLDRVAEKSGHIPLHSEAEPFLQIGEM